jgi:hypothetical protein
MRPSASDNATDQFVMSIFATYALPPTNLQSAIYNLQSVRVSIRLPATFPSYIRDHHTARWQELEQCTFDTAEHSFMFS